VHKGWKPRKKGWISSEEMARSAVSGKKEKTAGCLKGAELTGTFYPLESRESNTIPSDMGCGGGGKGFSSQKEAAQRSPKEMQGKDIWVFVSNVEGRTASPMKGK